jgi:hypothetical protein
MKIIVATIALVTAAAVSPASAAPLCVQTRDIVSTDSKDGKLMTFKMRDGRVLVNHLQGICTDLRFNGFVWTIRGPEEVCERQQSLQVLQSGQICTLGKFDLVKDKPPSQ